jgi:hypothetical protein
MLIYPEKPADEVVWATMDFTNRIKGRTISGITCNMIQFSSPTGLVDPTPQNMILAPPTMAGNIAVQKLLGGTPGINYALEFVLAYTDGTNSSEEGLVRVVAFRT